jgi:hypothetical protein
LIVDADGQGIEPGDLWEERLEGLYRGRGPRSVERADRSTRVTGDATKSLVGQTPGPRRQAAHRIRKGLTFSACFWRRNRRPPSRSTSAANGRS